MELAEDYADRAANAGSDYDTAYEQYLQRCINREDNDVKRHWHSAFSIKFERPIFNLI